MQSWIKLNLKVGCIKNALKYTFATIFAIRVICKTYNLNIPEIFYIPWFRNDSWVWFLAPHQLLQKNL